MEVQPELPGKETGSPKVEKMISEVREALQLFITEHRDQANPLRRAAVRPIRALASGGRNRADDALEQAAGTLYKFCQLLGETMPASRKDQEFFLERLNSPELREKLKESLRFYNM